MLGPGDRPLDLAEVGERVADCIAAVRRGDAESDSLNRLVVVAGLNWRQVNVLRAYRMYRQRIGSRFTQGYQNDVLAANPEVTAKLMRYFELRFDPAPPRATRRRRARCARRSSRDLDAVVSLDHDRILRNQLGLIDATLRTNAFKADRKVIAFKLRSADVPAIPQPAPVFEIYVYSPAMEGIHLRGGKVARGGIRWSDRQDYRTEVYGLMRAQLTKNAVIVPAGAKGGFYLKRPPADRDELRAEVERQYVRYIGGLLELTDNLVEGVVVHPDARPRARRGRHVPRRRRRQGHGDVLGHREPRQRGARLLARRRVRLGRVHRLRPQGARHHGARRVGVGQAPLLRARRRRRGRPVHGRRDRRHVGRRVRQRDAAVGPDPAGRRLRPPARLPRPGPRCRRSASPSASGCSRCPGSSWDDYDRAQDLRGRRRVAAQRQVDPALAAGARRARGSRTSGSRRPR